MSRTSDDFPEPDTPVTATKFPSGILTLMFARLCSRAPKISTSVDPRGRRTSGTGIFFFPVRYWPVSEFFALPMPLTGPE